MTKEEIDQKLKDLDAKIESSNQQIANNTNILNQLHGYAAGLKEAKATLLAEAKKECEKGLDGACANQEKTQ